MTSHVSDAPGSPLDAAGSAAGAALPGMVQDAPNGVRGFDTDEKLHREQIARLATQNQGPYSTLRWHTLGLRDA